MQVMALIGIEVPTEHQGGKVYGFDGVTSDWSNTQTITIPESNTSPTPTPYLPPRNPPHLDPIYYLIPASIIVAIVVLSLLLYRSHRKTISQNKPSL